jgi:hypothetical protein
MTQAILDDAWLRQYEQVLERIRAEQTRLQQETIPRLENAVTAVGVLALGVAGILLQRRLREALHEIDGRTMQVGALVESGGLPLRLAESTEVWADLRGRVTTGIHQLAIATPAVRESWQGLSAYAYLYVEDTQVRATSKLDEVVVALTQQLVDAAESALAFYIGLMIEVISLALWLDCALAALATVVTWPEALQCLGQALLCAASIEFAVIIEQHDFAGRTPELAKLVGGLSNHDTFPGGHWPPANTSGYRDGSVSDGTPTDWTATHTYHGPVPS